MLAGEPQTIVVATSVATLVGVVAAFATTLTLFAALTLSLATITRGWDWAGGVEVLELLE